MENNLQEGWSECSLGEILTSKKGKKPSSVINEPKTGYVPYILIDEMEGNPIRNYTNDPKVAIIDESEVLLVWDGSIGKCGSGMSGAIGSTLVGLKALGGIQTKFLEYIIKHQNNFIRETSTGTGLQHINKDFFEICKIPLPPLAEQHRIVAKLDALFDKIESNKKRLDKIPVILKRFRQSVLAAAVSGKLTEDWREKNKMNNEWPSKQLDNIADVIDTHPSHRTPPTDENGVPYIGMGDIHDDGTIDFKNARRVSNSVLKEHINRYSISEGDFIFGKIGTIGKPIFIPTKRNYTISPNVILIKPKKDEVQYMYLYYYLNSAVFFEEVQLETKATSQPAYGIKKMRARVIPLPSISEQKIIINRVTLLMNYADKLEARYTKAKAMLDKLPQSILAKAFRGELVVQDPNDEPASVLLERIKEEKEILKPVKNTRKKK